MDARPPEETPHIAPGEARSTKRPGAFWLAVTTLVVLSCLLTLMNYRLHFNGFLRNDNHEYCQLARNFYEGNGYSTSVLRPLAYTFFSTLPQPEVTRMPIYPYCLSLFFHILGPNDTTIVIFNSLFFIFLVLLTFLVSVELSGNIVISLFSALITASMQAFYRDTITAEPNIFYTTIFLVFIYAYIRFPNRLLLHGVMLAILHLIRANTLFVVAAFCLVLFGSARSWKERFSRPLMLIAGFTLGLVPYMLRNYIVIGKPFFSLYKYSYLLATKEFPKYTIWTMISNVDPSSYVLSHPAEMFQKSCNLLIFLVNDFLAVYKPVFLLIVGLAFLAQARSPRLNFLKLMIVAGFIVQTLVLLPVGSVAYYYVFFFPLMISLAMINAAEYLKKYAWVAFLCVFAVFLYTSDPYWKTPRPINPFPVVGKQLSELTAKDDIILTDIPWEVAWYADRRTIWLTYDIDTLTVISRTLKPKYIMIMGYEYAPYKDNVWGRVRIDPAYAESLGFKLHSPIILDGRPIAFLYQNKT